MPNSARLNLKKFSNVDIYGLFMPSKKNGVQCQMHPVG